jgi:hypothetical protein
MSAREIGRNDSCPCGSGLKYKRCCLSRREAAGRTTARLEAGVVELGRWARAEHDDSYHDAFAEFYAGGWEAFGLFGPDASELLAADLWLTCDVPLANGRTVLEAIGQELLHEDVVDALASSAIRTWRIEAVRTESLIDVSCLATGERSLIDVGQLLLGDIAPGRLLVGRAVADARERGALIGRGVVVAPEAQDDFEDLFWQLSFDQPDTARLWQESGGELASAALAWPEHREHTREGEIVRETHVSFDLPDCGAMARALDAAPNFRRTGQEFWDSETIAWEWRAPRAESPPAAMPDDLGVIWWLCDEDVEDPPIEATIEVNLDEESLCLFAPAPRRFERCERDFTDRFRDLLGPPADRGYDLIEIVPRWKRARWERTTPTMAGALARMRGLAA